MPPKKTAHNNTFNKGLKKTRLKRQVAPPEIKETITAKHREQLETISKMENSLPHLEQKLADAQQQLASLEASDYQTLEPIHFTQMAQLRDQIKQLKADIERIPNQHIDYLLQNGPLIQEYHELNQNTQKIKRVAAKDLFKRNRVDLSTGQKSQCLRQFFSNIDPDFTFTNHTYITEENFCQDCDSFRVAKLNEAGMVCPKCGSEISVIVESDKPSLKDPPPDSRHYEYKRYHHFCDWLAKIQGKENFEVSEEVINVILVEIKRERVSDLSKLDEATIRRYLKKYPGRGFDKYYNHITQILFKINKVPPLTLTPEQEREYKQMFMMIQEPFERHRPDNRSNFSSYSYVIYKFSQLLGYENVAKRMNLLKSSDKLYQLDQLWRKICDDLGGAKTGWVYIPSRKT